MRKASWVTRSSALLAALVLVSACGGSTPPPNDASSSAGDGAAARTDAEGSGEGHDGEPGEGHGGHLGSGSAEDVAAEQDDVEDPAAVAKAWPRGGGSKAEQCNALVAVLNEGVAGIEAAAGQREGAKIGDELRRMSSVMGTAAGKTSKVRLTLPELIRFAVEYRSMALSVSRHARAMADAADAGKLTKMKNEQAALDAAIKREDPLVDGINEYCAAP